MNSNLKAGSAIKEVLLKKLSLAVSCSVLSHLVVVLLYICAVNFNIQFRKWLGDTFNTLTSFSTWLYFLPFFAIIFAQIMISAKDYILKSSYQLSRFKKLLAVFSMRILTLGLLHIIVGGLGNWLYLSLSGGMYQSLFVKCKEEEYCLVESSFYIVLSGFWIGLYFFVRVYMTDKNLVFPVIQQSKLLHFKAKFFPILKESRNTAFYPVIYYFLVYYMFGPYICSSLQQILQVGLQENEEFSMLVYVYTWLFSVLCVLNMNLMRFFFELFLTEPVEHPVMSAYENDASLAEVLLLNNIPILQHLACLDLYLLSIWSPERRQALFTLSQPGGHPHTWNRLMEGALKLITEFTVTLNTSADALLGKEEKILTRNEILLNQSSLALLNIQLQKPPKFPHMRNMVLKESTDSADVVNFVQTTQSTNMAEMSETVSVTVTNKIAAVLDKIKNFRSIKYVFGELPEAHIQHCLKNGQLIVWITQGLANVAVASFNEDPYGIVQKDLPVLITSLVQLKQSIDKLNKVAMFSRKGQGVDNFSFKMKTSVHGAVRRSLFNICRTFGKYLNDFPVTRDTALQLQCYL